MRIATRSNPEPDDELFPRVTRVVAKIMDIPSRGLEPGSRLREDLGCDSLDLVEILMGLEAEFQLPLSDDEAESVRTIDQAVSFVRHSMGGPPPPGLHDRHR